MFADDRIIVRAVCDAFARGDLAAVLSRFAEDVTFMVRPQGAVSFLGEGRSRRLLAERLGRFLDTFEVVLYKPGQIGVHDDWVDCRIVYHYRDKKTGLDIDGRMRQLHRVVGDKIVHFEVIHDAQRMGAFFELVEQMGRAA